MALHGHGIVYGVPYTKYEVDLEKATMRPSHGSLHNMELSLQTSATPPALVCMLCQRSEGRDAEIGAVQWFYRLDSRLLLLLLLLLQVWL